MKKANPVMLKIDNAIIINTRCIEVMRMHKDTFYLSESEYLLCDKIGWEIAEMLPDGCKINPVHYLTTEEILEYAEHGTSSKSLLDEKKIHCRLFRLTVPWWFYMMAGLSIGLDIYLTWNLLHLLPFF